MYQVDTSDDTTNSADQSYGESETSCSSDSILSIESSIECSQSSDTEYENESTEPEDDSYSKYMYFIISIYQINLN